MYFNQTILIGRLAEKPELTVTEKSGRSLCKLSLGQTYKIGEGEDKKEITLWHKVAVWGKKAENCVQYLDKGSVIQVLGELRYNQFENKGGQRVKNAEIVAREITYLNGKNTVNELSKDKLFQNKQDIQKSEAIVF